MPGIGEIMDALCNGLRDVDGLAIETSDCDNDSGEIFCNAAAEDRATGKPPRRLAAHPDGNDAAFDADSES